VWDGEADSVYFVCDQHHVEMSEAKMVRLERRMNEKSWKKTNGIGILKT
jgi:hypothetical protein